jgi:hypothetical protein
MISATLQALSGCATHLCDEDLQQAEGSGRRLVDGRLARSRLRAMCRSPPLQLDLFWTAMLASNVLSGAGPLSLDRALSRGLKNAPLTRVNRLLALDHSQYAFAYRHMGGLVTIGRKSAIVDLL